MSHPRLPAHSTTSRREVLALGAAAALAGACSTPSTVKRSFTAVRGADRKRVEPGETLRIGIVGMGAESTPAMGFAHLRSFISLAKNGHEKVQVVAISDCAEPYLRRGVEEARRSQEGVAVEGYPDYRKMIERDDLHGILVATPEHWHARMAIDALMSGLDVYCEKPMTYDLDAALELRAVVHANPQCVLQVGTQYLQHRKFWKAKELIASGAIGKPTLSQASYCRNSKDGEWLYGIDPQVVPGKTLDWDQWCGPAGQHPFDPAVFFRWRRYRQWSSGIIGDLLVHVMTPYVWALDVGWPVRVTGTGGHYVDTAMENHDQVFLTVEFEKGHTLVVAGSTCNQTGLEMLIRGHQANLYLGGNDCVMRPEPQFAEEIAEQTFPSPALPVGDHDAHRLDWMTAMRTREKPIGDVDTAAKVMVIVDLATRSLWDGRAYTFDPTKLSAVGA
jgi:predicted dehydrogenase